MFLTQRCRDAEFYKLGKLSTRFVFLNSETGFDVKNLDPRPVELAVAYSTLDICLFLLAYQGKLKRSALNCQCCTIILRVKEYSLQR